MSVVILDETLPHSSYDYLGIPDAKYKGLNVYFRPGVKEFLRNLQRDFQVGVWSAGGPDYVETMVDLLFDIRPVIVFTYNECTKSYKHYEFYETGFEFSAQPQTFKKLEKVSRKLKTSLDQILIVDDLPSNARKNYGNAITIPEFTGDPNDRVLEKLGIYLRSFIGCLSVRFIEKRDWLK